MPIKCVTASKTPLGPELPPDPDGQNGDRAMWAENALEYFQGETGTDSEDAICDLICDLMHLCDRKPEEYGTWERGLKRGAGHYHEETLAMLEDEI